MREVAKLLRVCTATVYKWVASGILPHIRIMNPIRVRPQCSETTSYRADEMLTGDFGARISHSQLRIRWI